jgi:D-aminopeptidase
MEAIKNASEDFEEGDIGGGKGMSCHQLKGGIGSASRVFSLAGKEYTLGVLVQSNYGLLKDLSINGKKIGLEIEKEIELKKEEDKGSIIIIIATDLPLSSRQLNRICKRASVGLIRTGSYIGNGSGDIIIGFSTANPIKYKEKIEDDDLDCIINQKILNENKINIPFRAVSEATEEAILNSMITAEEVIGYKGNKRFTLKSFINLL